MIFMLSTRTEAATWLKLPDNSYKYMKDNGYFAKNEWLWIGKTGEYTACHYYFDDNERMVTSLQGHRFNSSGQEINNKDKVLTRGATNPHVDDTDNTWVDMFGNKSIGLKVTDEIKNKSKGKRLLLIDKSAHTLQFWDDETLRKEYTITSGLNRGEKTREGDRVTPNGEFYVCLKNSGSKYTAALGVSYPMKRDADRGLANGIINEQTKDWIYQQIDNNGISWGTPLGGLVEIHGLRGLSDNSHGCIQMKDSEIAELYSQVEQGDTIIIRE